MRFFDLMESIVGKYNGSFISRETTFINLAMWSGGSIILHIVVIECTALVTFMFVNNITKLGDYHIINNTGECRI